MDTKVNYAVIGAFIIILFSFIVLSIIWLSSGLSVEHYKIYQVNMQEAVTGLSIDAAVEFNGVNIGNVKSIAINEHNPHLVELLLNIRNNTPITQGTFAILGTRGLTGITYISLKDKGEDLKPLKALPGQEYPIIKTGPSIFLQMDMALGKLNESVKRVSDSLSMLLDKENLQSIKEILNNTDKITSTIAINNERLNKIFENTLLITQRFPLLLQSSTRTMQMLEAHTLPKTNQIVDNLTMITNNLSTLSSELRANPAMLIRGKEPQPLGPGEK